MVWNFGYDVTSVSMAEPAEGETLAYVLESKNGQKFRFSVGLAGGGKSEPRLSANLFRGQTEPRRGWYSPVMYKMRPSYILLVDIGFDEPATVATRIEKVEKKYFPGLRILIKGY
jgi:hypothetical protein